VGFVKSQLSTSLHPNCQTAYPINKWIDWNEKCYPTSLIPPPYGLQTVAYDECQKVIDATGVGFDRWSNYTPPTPGEGESRQPGWF